MRFIYIIVVFLFSCSLASNDKQRNPEMGQLQVIGTQLSDEDGKPISLVGVSFGWSNWHSRFYSAGSVKWLKEDWNINVIRAAMGVEPNGAYLNNRHFNERLVETVVDEAIKQGLYVIIDWHAHDLHTEKAADFFDRMSKKYGQFPNVIYEIFNEPDHESWPEVKKYSEEIIRVIRKNDPDNIILVGSPEWDQRLDLVQEDPIRGVSNIMYTFHFYAGTHRKNLRDRVDRAIASGIPVFVSESGVSEANGDGIPDYDEMEKFIEWMTNHKMSWVSWSVSDKDEVCSMLLPTASSNGNWKVSDLNESGIKTKEYLKRFNKRGEYLGKVNQ